MSGVNKRTILITNDDGIDAPGIVRLAEAAKRLGEVWVIAPEHQRSAASHSIILREVVKIKEHDFPVEGVKAFSCSGTPADCVRCGGLGVMPYRPDVVLSGINYGYNVAGDIQYSATAGAAFEAAYQGFGAIALSEDSGTCHEVTDAYLQELLEDYIDERYGRNRILNINFPGCRLSECKGIQRNRIVSMDSFYHARYKQIETKEDGTMIYMVDDIYNDQAEEGTDFRAILEGYVSVGLVQNIT
ncbi:MAG: 5'/3'-nucleotidase SurE [Lachnospiraceae bacterium]|nr:5'/3'-nucleotidase SurE [Lachnospiraceae bacterium]